MKVIFDKILGRLRQADTGGSTPPNFAPTEITYAALANLKKALEK